jgi:hypothetical protein
VLCEQVGVVGRIAEAEAVRLSLWGVYDANMRSKLVVSSLGTSPAAVVLGTVQADECAKEILQESAGGSVDMLA